ncbi:MAG: NAD(+) diphosphatase [bacterium]|nr:NAD(+) diphosphatase [bacterium]
MKNKFIKENAEPKETSGKSYWFVFQGDKLLVTVNGDECCNVPMLDRLPGLEMEPLRQGYLGQYENKCCWWAEVPDDVKPPGNMGFYTLRQLYYRMDDDLFWAAGYAFQITQFEQTHQYCGRCGSKTEAAENERAKICHQCGLINYPRVSPSMIAAVIKEGKILLARSTRFKRGFYSVLAGFVEPGETLEECVKREVKEEVATEVKNIKYFGSQPWPFPHSLMVGFIADYHKGEISIDEDEIVAADWYSVADLPEIPGKISIARRLIDWFIENYKV